MSSEEILLLQSTLDSILFWVQTTCLFCSCGCSFLILQLCIYTKNQKHLF